MSTSEKLTGKDIAAELNKAHTPAELNKALTDSVALKNGSTQTQWNKALATINAGVDLKRLGLNNFTITDVDSDKGGTALLEAASKDGKEGRIIAPTGELYKIAAGGKLSDMGKNALSDAGSPSVPAADAAPTTMNFGNHNRQMTVTSDGSDAAYSVKKGDNLWSVAKDYLEQQGKADTNKDIANMVNTIARENHIQNADHLKVNEQIHFNPIQAREVTTPQTAASAEVAPPATRPAVVPESVPPATPTAAAAPEAAPPATPTPTASPEAAPAATPAGFDGAPQPHKSEGIGDTLLGFASPIASGWVGSKVLKSLAVAAIEGGEHSPNLGTRLFATGAGVLGAVITGEVLDKASHKYLGSESHTQTEILVGSLAGLGGSVASKQIGHYAPKFIGEKVGQFAPKLFGEKAFLTTLGASTAATTTQFSVIGLGQVNPLTTDHETGEHYTMGQTMQNFEGQIIQNFKFGVVLGGLGAGASKVGSIAKSAGRGLYGSARNFFAHSAAEAPKAGHAVLELPASH